MKNLRPSINCSNCKHVVATPGAYDYNTYICNVTKPVFLSIRRREMQDKFKVSAYQVCDLHEPKEEKK